MQNLHALTHFDDALLNHPRRTLFIRLIGAWLVLTVVCAFAAMHFGFMQVDAQLADEVKQEAARYSTLFSDYVAAPTPGHKLLLDQELSRLTGDGFRIVRLYDQEGRLVIERQSSDTPGYTAELDRRTAERPSAETDVWQRVKLFGHPHLVMAGAIRDKAGDLAGYGTAVYRFDERTVEALESLVRMVSLVIALTVFASFLMVYPLVNFLNRRVLRSARELMRSNIGTLKTLGSAIAKRDSDTGMHNYRVTTYAVRIAEALHLERDQIQRLIIGSFLHDIGKIAIPDAILLKRGGHTPQEKQIMRQHVGHGVDIVSQYAWLAKGVDVVAGHHERYDGSGYPKGLKGEKIPRIARIFAVADVFDALASERPYKKPFPYDRIVEMLTGELSNQFDPVVLAAFIPISRELYSDCARLDDACGEKMLAEIVGRYFPDSAPVRPPPRRLKAA